MDHCSATPLQTTFIRYICMLPEVLAGGKKRIVLDSRKLRQGSLRLNGKDDNTTEK